MVVAVDVVVVMMAKKKVKKIGLSGTKIAKIFM
jgi:hypothetical protein